MTPLQSSDPTNAGGEADRAPLVLDAQSADLLFRQAHTTYSFTDQPVTDAEVRAIHDLVKWGPTALNGQPLRVTLVRSDEARQRLIGLEERLGEDGIRRCALVLDPELICTTAVPRRPFQGWRYLDADDAPPDLAKGRDHDDALPAALAAELAEMGLR